MKFKKYIGVGIFSLLFVTGCGDTQKLECSVQQDYYEGIKTHQNVVAVFDGEMLAKLSIDMDVKLDESSIEYADNLINGSTSNFEKYKDKDGFSYSTTKKDDGFEVDLDVNFKETDDDVKDNFSFLNAYSNYEQIKQELESNGYTCK